MKIKPGIPTVKHEKEAYQSLTRHVVMVRVGLNIPMHAGVSDITKRLALAMAIGLDCNSAPFVYEYYANEGFIMLLLQLILRIGYVSCFDMCCNKK